MTIVAWSLNLGGNNIKDFWIVCETSEDAAAEVTKLLDIDNLHCWAVADIKAGSEPHWLP